MIGKVLRSQGGGLAGLMRYLFGPGKANDHTDPRVVGGWDDPAELEPPGAGVNGRDTAPLTRLLGQPLRACAREPKDPVWHCVLSIPADDGPLTDEAWAEVARDVVERAGFTPARGAAAASATSEVDPNPAQATGAANDEGEGVHGELDEPAGCRWVAVRHGLSKNGNDHVHLIVTLATEDGRPVHPRNDYYAVGAACTAAETRLGLVTTARRDRTAGARPSRGETEKATRIGLGEPARVTLRREVRLAAAGAAGTDGFFEGLRDAGLLVRERHSTTTAEQVTGYAVALPGHRTAAGEPVWFGGGKLAADLTLPKLTRRWDPAGVGAAPAGRGSGGGASGADRTRLTAAEREAVWSQAQQTATAAAAQLRTLTASDPAAAADIAWGASDALAVAARMVEGPRGGPLSKAADDFDRAGREAWGRIPAPTSTGNGLRALARTLALCGRARTDEGTQIAAFALNLLALVEATRVLRETQDRAGQARAARAAEQALHTRAGVPAAAAAGPAASPKRPGPAGRRPPPGPDPGHGSRRGR